MPSNMDYKDNNYDIDITSDIPITHTTVEFNTIIRNLTNINNIMPLKEFKFDRQGNGPNHNYILNTVDNRNWNQVIVDDGTSNPLMNFTTDYFKLSEFSAQRELRNTIIQALVKYKVSKLTVKW